MGRNLVGTKERDIFIEKIGDFDNPNVHQFAWLFARYRVKTANGTTLGEPRYYIDDIIDIGPDDYPGIKPNSITTCGRYMFNKFVILTFGGVIGYINKEITSGTMGDLEDVIADALLAKDITQEQVCEFINRSQYLLGGPLAHIINPSISSTILRLPNSAKRVKAAKMKEYSEGIAADDPAASAAVEHATVDEAMRVMEASGDPALAFFKSGAIDPYNNYRTMFVMKGAIEDNTGLSPTGYKIVKSDYDTGLTKEDLPKIADSVVTTAYSSGVSTQDSGYLGKKYNVILQNVVLLGPGSDCGSTETLSVKISDRHLYRYIVVGGKLVLITPESISKYKGQVHKLRTPIHCKAKGSSYCSVCCGDRLHRIGIQNVGQTFNTISGSTLNAALKKKHDVSIKFYHATAADLLKYVK